MTERPTVKIELPITKQEAVVREWLTGREYEEMQKPFYESVKKGENGLDMQYLTHQTLLAYVVSVGGKTENILETILDLPFDDYNAILQRVNELKKKE